MQKTTVWIIIIVVIILLGLCIVKYNTLAGLDEQLESAWTPLTNVLEPRYQQVPKLVNEVILYTGKEDKQTKELADAYKKYSSASGMSGQIEAANKLEAALSNLAIQGGQRYPGITSHYQFQNLMSGFKKSGDQMKGLVTAYNSAVDTYNTYVRKFPNNLVAFLVGFEFKANYFKRSK